MTASQTHSIIVKVLISKDGSVFVATSPTLNGLLVVSEDEDKLRNALIPRAIEDLYAACDVKMVVTRLGAEETADFVATPLAAIKASQASAAA